MKYNSTKENELDNKELPNKVSLESLKGDVSAVKEELIELEALIKGVFIRLEPKRWLRSKDVRQMLGISAFTLQNMRINHIIPFTRVGSTLFYDSGQILALMELNKVN